MAKPVKSAPLMITIAEKVGTTVGMIVAKTSDAVEGASKLMEGATKSLKPAPTAKPKPAAKRKVAVTKKKSIKKATATVTRKRPAKKPVRHGR